MLYTLSSLYDVRLISLSVKDKNKNYRLTQNTHRLIMNTPYLFSNTPYLLRSKLAEKYSAIYLVFHSLLRIFAAWNVTKVIIMTVTAWESLPVEVRKYLVKKRMEASDKYQGSATVEKYGVYMKDWWEFL